MVVALATDPPEGLGHFCTFAGLLTLENRRHAVIEPFQKVMLHDYFGGTTETLILIPKKNGKTTLLALVALHHLCFTDDAEVVIAASSRDQATILFDQAAGFIKRSELLQKRLVVKRGYREIRSLRDSGRIRVMASDVDTVDGVIPTLALVDELHRHKSSELYGVFRDGLGPRNGHMLTISTAGDDEDSALGVMRKMALLLPDVQVEGRHTYARDDAGSFAMHEWALRETDNMDDLGLVKEANPASWQTEDRLRERRQSPSTTDWQWGRFACGLWLKGEGSAISPADWTRCMERALIIPRDAPIYLGLDLAWSVDSTAVVPLWMEGPERRVVGPPVVLEPPGDGSLLDERAVVWAILVYAGIWKWNRREFEATLSDENPPDLVARWAHQVSRARPARVLKVVYDEHAGGQQMVQQLRRAHGLQFVAHSQDNAPMALASQRLQDAIPRFLRHDGDGVLRAHALTAIQRWLGGEKWKYDRPKRGKRKPIDALTALEFAHSVAVAEMEAEPVERPRVEILV